jgi:15-cis-phytoene synthase
MNKTEQLEKAYKYCESVTRLHAKSFYFAAKFLPREKQPAVYALYALCRHVDDEVDEAEFSNDAQIAEAVARWRSRLNRIYSDAFWGEGEKGSVPKAESGIWNLESGINEDQSPKTEDRNLVFLAWQDLLKKYKIPQNLPLELMKGVLMDTRINRYETFDELYVYCYRVASTVGLMSSEIFGYEDAETLDYAEALGIAMQLTNILRDIAEDARMNRIYLPQEDLRKFDVSETQIFENRPDENFINLLKFQIARAREFYRKAEKGIPLLNQDARFTVLLAARIYAKILDEIERQNYDVFARRAHTTFKQKIFSVPNIWREARKMKPDDDKSTTNPVRFSR